MSTAAPAPWKALFREQVSQKKSPEFALGTLGAAGPDAPVAYVPRVRYCIFRGFWAELPEKSRHSDDDDDAAAAAAAARNPAVYESDCPTFTTDVRMDKVGQIFATSAGHAASRDQVQGSGGGGPVEAVYWIAEAGTQWRIKGRAYVIADDIEGGDESSGVRTVKSEVGKRMRVVEKEGGGGGGQSKDWSWQRELTGFFGNQSPSTKGSFKNPPPGQSVEQPYDEQKFQLGSKTDRVDDAVARQNFRLVVIVPDSVEQLNLSDPERARRWRYTWEDARQDGATTTTTTTTGQWKTEELWP